MASRRTQEEKILFEKVKKHELAALAGLYDRYQQSLYGQIQYFELDRDQAEKNFERIFDFLWEKQDILNFSEVSPYRFCLNLTRLICMSPQSSNEEIEKYLDHYRGLEMILPGDVFEIQQEVEEAHKNLEKVSPETASSMKSFVFTTKSLDVLMSDSQANDKRELVSEFVHALKFFKEDFKADEFLNLESSTDLVLLLVGRLDSISKNLSSAELSEISKSDSYQAFQKAFIHFMATAPLEMPRKVVKKNLLSRLSPSEEEETDENEPIIVKVPRSAEEMAAKKAKEEPKKEAKRPNSQQQLTKKIETKNSSGKTQLQTQRKNEETTKGEAPKDSSVAKQETLFVEGEKSDFFTKYKIPILGLLFVFAVLFFVFVYKAISTQSMLDTQDKKHAVKLKELNNELSPIKFIQNDNTETYVLGNRLASKRLNGVFFYNQNLNQAILQLNKMDDSKTDIFYQLWLKEEGSNSFKSLLVVNGKKKIKNQHYEINHVLTKNEVKLVEIQLRRLNNNGSDIPQGRIVLRYRRSPI